MKRTARLLLMLLTGCSTAPCADLMDAWNPGQIEPGPVYGGVCTGPGCRPSVAPATNFATSPPDPAPAVVPVTYAVKPTAETAPPPAMAPATGSWKRMLPSSDAPPKPLATGP